MARAGIVDVLPGKIDQAQGSQFIGVPGIERHIFHILFQLRIEILLGNDQGGDRNGRRIRFFPLDIGIFDRRPFLIHEKLDAKIEADFPFPESFPQFLPEIMFTLRSALWNGAQYLGQLPSG